MFMIRLENRATMASGIFTRKPASTTRSGFNSHTLSVNALLNVSRSEKLLGDMQNPGIPRLSAQVSALAPALLLMTASISVLVICPRSIASKIA